MITQILDLRKEEELPLSVGSDVGIFSDIDSTSILLTMGQVENIDNTYRKLVGESTHQEQEETILKQQTRIEELEEIIERQENYEQLTKELLSEHEVF